MSLKSKIYFSPLFYVIHYLGVIRKMGGVFSCYMDTLTNPEKDFLNVVG